MDVADPAAAKLVDEGAALLDAGVLHQHAGPGVGNGTQGEFEGLGHGFRHTFFILRHEGALHFHGDVAGEGTVPHRRRIEILRH
jgi:hypothetical protein